MGYAAKYPTKQLKKEIDLNAGRIKELEESKGMMEDHLRDHEKFYDKQQKIHKDILFGEKGDDGLTHDFKLTNALLQRKDRLSYAVIAAIVIELVSRFIFD
jgi:hypothetical protein